MKILNGFIVFGILIALTTAYFLRDDELEKSKDDIALAISNKPGIVFKKHSEITLDEERPVVTENVKSTQEKAASVKRNVGDDDEPTYKRFSGQDIINAKNSAMMIAQVRQIMSPWSRANYEIYKSVPENKRFEQDSGSFVEAKKVMAISKADLDKNDWTLIDNKFGDYLIVGLKPGVNYETSGMDTKKVLYNGVNRSLEVMTGKVLVFFDKKEAIQNVGKDLNLELESNFKSIPVATYKADDLDFSKLNATMKALKSKPNVANVVVEFLNPTVGNY